MKKNKQYRLCLAGLVVLLLAGCKTAETVPPTMLEQARTALSAGQYEQALQMADGVLQENDRQSEALTIRGIAAVELKEYAMGREALKMARGTYGPDSRQGRQLLKKLAQAEFYLKEFTAAEVPYQAYLNAKKSAGSILLDDDLYWAGVIADVNLKNAERDRYWSKLSSGFKKTKGIQ